MRVIERCWCSQHADTKDRAARLSPNASKNGSMQEWENFRKPLVQMQRIVLLFLLRDLKTPRRMCHNAPPICRAPGGKDFIPPVRTKVVAQLRLSRVDDHEEPSLPIRNIATLHSDRIGDEIGVSSRTGKWGTRTTLTSIPAVHVPDSIRWRFPFLCGKPPLLSKDRSRKLGG